MSTPLNPSRDLLFVKQIQELDTADALENADLIPVEQNGRVKKATVEDIFGQFASANAFEDFSDAVSDQLALAVYQNNNQVISGQKTFTAPPVVPNPTLPTHAVNKAVTDDLQTQLTTLDASAVKTSGTQSITGAKTFTESVTFNAALLIPVTPTANNHAASKVYVDNNLALKANVAGNQTLSGVKTFSDPLLVTGTGATISASNQLTSKAYVDSSDAAAIAHIARTNNPHNVTASQVGNVIPQWNSNQIQGRAVSPGTPVLYDEMVWDTTTGWTPSKITQHKHNQIVVSSSPYVPTPAAIKNRVIQMGSGSASIELPNPATAGMGFCCSIRHNGGSPKVINVNGGLLINGSVTYTLVGFNDSIEVFCNGVSYFITSTFPSTTGVIPLDRGGHGATTASQARTNLRTIDNRFGELRGTGANLNFNLNSSACGAVYGVVNDQTSGSPNTFLYLPDSTTCEYGDSITLIKYSGADTWRIRKTNNSNGFYGGNSVIEVGSGGSSITSAIRFYFLGNTIAFIVLNPGLPGQPQPAWTIA